MKHCIETFIEPRGVIATVLALMLLLGGAVSAALPASVEGGRLPSLAPMLERVTPAVVNIATRGSEIVRENPLMSDPFFRRFFKLPNRQRRRATESLGSGVIVDADRGYVMTNHHVIDKASEITVTLRDGRSLKAELVGTDPDTDVAVIQVPAAGLTALTMADSERLRVGDFVVAIGNPFGLGQTVTSGIVSALGRSGLGIEGYEDFIQTDASINVGNSGGALVNLRGELVGINTAILAPGGGSVGVGFAIPANMAADIMTQLVSHGRVRRGLLGLVAQDLTPALAEAFGLPTGNGAIVVHLIPESAAARAGLKEGDILQYVDGKPIRNARDVRTKVGLSRVGALVRLTVLRDGRKRVFEVRVEAPDTSIVEGGTLHRRLNGVQFGSIDPKHPLFGRAEGAMIVEMQANSNAVELGLRPGDIVVAVNGKRLATLKQFARASSAAKRPLILDIRRRNLSRRLVLR
jgi:Do/DeqQ family serine protease